MMSGVMRTLAMRCASRHDDLWLIDSTPVECGRSRETAKRSDGSDGPPREINRPRRIGGRLVDRTRRVEVLGLVTPLAEALGTGRRERVGVRLERGVGDVGGNPVTARSSGDAIAKEQHEGVGGGAVGVVGRRERRLPQLGVDQDGRRRQPLLGPGEARARVARVEMFESVELPSALEQGDDPAGGVGVHEAQTTPPPSPRRLPISLPDLYRTGRYRVEAASMVPHVESRNRRSEALSNIDHHRSTPRLTEFKSPLAHPSPTGLKVLVRRGVAGTG